MNILNQLLLNKISYKQKTRGEILSSFIFLIYIFWGLGFADVAYFIFLVLGFLGLGSANAGVCKICVVGF